MSLQRERVRAFRMGLLSALVVLGLLFGAAALQGCSGAVEDAPPVPPAACPAVECAFPQGVCPEGNTYVEHTAYDDGAGCWMRTAACFPANTPAGCEPADCYSETSLACGAAK